MACIEANGSLLACEGRGLRRFLHDLPFEHLLVALNVSRIWSNVLLVAEPDFLCYLANQSKVVGDQHQSTIECIDRLCQTSMHSISKWFVGSSRSRTCGFTNDINSSTTRVFKPSDIVFIGRVW